MIEYSLGVALSVSPVRHSRDHLAVPAGDFWVAQNANGPLRLASSTILPEANQAQFAAPLGLTFERKFNSLSSWG